MIRFLHPKLKEEFGKIDRRLRIIILAFAQHLKEKNQGDVLMTHILRTQEEQDAIYTSDKVDKETRDRYIATPWRSTHQDGRAVDVSIRMLDLPEYQEQWLNKHFNYDERDKYPTAKLHNIGHGSHLHIQVSWRCETRIT